MWFNFVFYILVEKYYTPNTCLKRRHYFQPSFDGLSEREALGVAQYDNDILWCTGIWILVVHRYEVPIQRLKKN